MQREDQQRERENRQRLLKEISSDSRVKFKSQREKTYLNAHKKMRLNSSVYAMFKGAETYVMQT